MTKTDPIDRRLRAAARNLLLCLVRYRVSRAAYRFVPGPVRHRLLAALEHGVVTAPGFRSLPPLASNRDATCAMDEASRVAVKTGEGVNVFGHLHGEFGLGESARMYAGALIGAGVPVTLNDLAHDVPHAFGDTSLDVATRQGAPYAVNLLFANPDYMQRAIEFVGPAAWEGRTTIGCWFWELETIPGEWQEAIDAVDGIMVASAFTEEAFRRATDKPVFRVKLPLPALDASDASRRDFDLPEDAFVFLVSFDFNSSIYRKNPIAAIDAFRSAFPSSREDVRLMVKSSNGHRYPEHMSQLLAAASQDPRILVRDQVLPIAHMHALQKCADAYVSLHRAEGFGLGLAESMAMGKPVIATAWSGNMDFMDADNSCLVDYRLVPVGEGEYPHAAGTRWADPDTQQAAAWMRRLVDTPGLAAGLGRKAADHIRSDLSPDRAASAIVDAIRLITIRREERPCPN